jgi:serine-type D-Ala-D-Ala carboxypeptidase
LNIGNTYAMGGISGHAGVFATVQDISNLASNLLSSVTRSSSRSGAFLLNATTLELFTNQHSRSQSSRALGWDTNSYEIDDFGYTNSCGALSQKTFMHIGYTGTCICIDPVDQVWTVILTNRVYGCSGNETF